MKSFERACYYLITAKDLLEANKLERKQYQKQVIGRWIDRLSYLIGEIKLSLTPESKKLFDQEMKADPVQLVNVHELMLSMRIG